MQNSFEHPQHPPQFREYQVTTFHRFISADDQFFLPEKRLSSNQKHIFTHTGVSLH